MLRLVNKNIKNILMRNLVFRQHIVFRENKCLFKTSLISDKILVISIFSHVGEIRACIRIMGGGT